MSIEKEKVNKKEREKLSEKRKQKMKNQIKEEKFAIKKKKKRSQFPYLLKRN